MTSQTMQFLMMVSAQGTGSGPTAVNLLANTEDFGAAWNVKTGTTIAASAEALPSGVAVSDSRKFTATGTSGFKLLNQDDVNVGASLPIVFSIYAKADEVDDLYMALQDQVSPNGNCYFNLAAGTVGTRSGLEDAGIDDFGGGWYRCWIKTTTNGTGTSVDCDTALADGESVSFTNVAGDGLHITGAMLESGVTTPSAYAAP